MSTPAPGWIVSGADATDGLDLLALRAPTMRIGNALLDGITTITPSVRYFSLVTWITLRYWQSGGEDSRRGYLAFARHLEAAFVLGNLRVAPGTRGLIGSEAFTAPEAMSACALDIQVRALGTNVYRGPAEQLGLLISSTAAAVPHLTESRGLPLAMAVEATVGQTALGRRLSQSPLPSSATMDELTEFGQLFRVNNFPPEEKALLLSAILPPYPATPMERRRLATYGAFLACAAGGQPPDEYRQMLTEAVRRKLALPPLLRPILDGWNLYLVRDVLAVVHEFAFHAAIQVLPRGAVYADQTEILRESFQNTTEIDAALGGLGLIEPGENWQAIPFMELDRRVQVLTSRSERVKQGLRFWDDGLQEPGLILAAKAPGVAPALLPVAYLLVERRVGEGVKACDPTFLALSHEGAARLGLEQGVFPRLERFRAGDISFGQAAAELMAVTVEQHLQTSWGRLADSGNDVSVMLTDGSRWAYRKNFYPGQMDSRLSQVRNWTQQLGLLTAQGLTIEGEDALRGIQAALSTPEPA
jgi:hypothetical protein